MEAFKKSPTLAVLLVIAVLLFLNSFLLLENAFHKTLVREEEGPYPAPRIKEEHELTDWSSQFKQLMLQVQEQQNTEVQLRESLEEQKKLLSEVQKKMESDKNSEQEHVAFLKKTQELQARIDALQNQRQQDQEVIENLVRQRTEDMAKRINNPPAPPEAVPYSAGGQGEERGTTEFDDNWQVPTNIAIQADTARRDSVAAEIAWAWHSYQDHCFGQDEVISGPKTCKNWLGLGLTIVDSLDTLYLAGLSEEYNKARTWIADSLNFDVNKKVSIFETTIRVVGGLLSMHGLTNDVMYLKKAQDLVDRFLPAFHTDTNIPLGLINLKTGKTDKVPWAKNDVAFLAEYGTLQLEFCYLSRHLKDPLYCRLAEALISFLETKSGVFPGLYATDVNTRTGEFVNDHISLGAMGDSYYEYLIKMWIWTGKPADSMYLRMYKQSVQSVLEKFIKRQAGYTYLRQYDNGRFMDTMDHLACFVPGMLALGVLHGASSPSVLNTATDLLATCIRMYTESPSGISPDRVTFTASGMENPTVQGGDASYHLRPEVVESIFIMYRVTRQEKYREWGWRIFQSLKKCCRLDTGGYHGLENTEKNTQDKHEMESFFIAETLKYLYLLFDEEETLPISGEDAFVFNTEAHPLPAKFLDDAVSGPAPPSALPNDAVRLANYAVRSANDAVSKST
eukprot:gb/GEZN01003278.1/.p1 GENE.gb/GEZN01003278.1/~~gb/GEZN01003278.1/.p1  ORF type:complete len:678 (+),score=69.99 gb/GEZN01003278.1/:24-2057(+)